MASLHTDRPRTWSGGRDSDGFRTYKAMWIVETTTDEGPAAVLACPGLPLPGSMWAIGGDLDPWVWCRPEMEVKIHEEKEGEAAEYWSVIQTFSNKPLPRNQRQGCQDVQVEDPLLEPQQVSGGFTKYTEEARYDRYGTPIINSAWEVVTGPTVEFDKNRPTVRISQNVPLLQLELFGPMIDTVNSSTLWGLGARRIKLSNVTWEKKFWGQCQVYYTRTFEFDVRTDTFDRTLQDVGTKVLQGHWGRGNPESTGTVDGNQTGWILDPIYNPATTFFEDPDPLNPAHFMRAIDRQGNLISVILDGSGRPYDPVGSTVGTDDDQPGTIYIEKYGESDFLLLGIPTVL